MRAEGQGESTVGVSRNGKDVGGSPGSTENCSHIPFLFNSVLILLFKQFHSSTQIPHQTRVLLTVVKLKTGIIWAKEVGQ